MHQLLDKTSITTKTFTLLLEEAAEMIFKIQRVRRKNFWNTEIWVKGRKVFKSWSKWIRSAPKEVFPDDAATKRRNASKRISPAGCSVPPCYPPDFSWKTFAEQTSAAASLTDWYQSVPSHLPAQKLKSILIVNFIQFASLSARSMSTCLCDNNYGDCLCLCLCHCHCHCHCLCHYLSLCHHNCLCDNNNPIIHSLGFSCFSSIRLTQTSDGSWCLWSHYLLYIWKLHHHQIHYSWSDRCWNIW